MLSQYVFGICFSDVYGAGRCNLLTSFSLLTTAPFIDYMFRIINSLWKQSIPRFVLLNAKYSGAIYWKCETIIQGHMLPKTAIY